MIENYFRFQEGKANAARKRLGSEQSSQQSAPSAQQGSKYQIIEVSE